jgi:hypothetical protein
VTSTLDGGCNHALGYTSVSTTSTRLDATLFVGVTLEEGKVLVIDFGGSASNLGSALTGYWVTALNWLSADWH